MNAAGPSQGANYSLWGQRAERSGDSRKRGGPVSALREAKTRRAVGARVRGGRRSDVHMLGRGKEAE